MTQHNGNGAADDSGERIRRHMSAVRAQLAHDADEVVDATRSMTDWRVYVRRYPWLFLGGAALVGYALVPRRVATVMLDAATLRQLAGLRGAAATEARPSLLAGVVGTVVSLGAKHAMRGLATYLAQRGQQPSVAAGHPRRFEDAEQS